MAKQLLHPLAVAGVKVFSAKTPNEWECNFKYLRDTAPSVSALCGEVKGLLRSDYTTEQARQAITILLDLADGHNNAHVFVAEGEKNLPFDKKNAEAAQHLRQRVAQQAWAELCRHVFGHKERKLSHYTDALMRVTHLSAVRFVERVLEFFNPTPVGREPNVPIEKSHVITGEAEEARQGVAAFVGDLWRHPSPLLDEEDLGHLRTLRVKSIPIMLAYGLFHDRQILPSEGDLVWPHEQLLVAFRKKIRSSTGDRGWLGAHLLAGNKDAQTYQHLKLCYEDIQRKRKKKSLKAA